MKSNTRRRVLADPIFAAINAHKDADKAHTAACDRHAALLFKTEESEKNLPTAAIHASKHCPAYWLGNAYEIQNPAQAKKHVQRIFNFELQGRVGRKTLAKIKRLRAFAVAELVAELRKVEAAHAAQRKALGIDALWAARKQARRAEREALSALTKTRAASPAGLAAFIAYAKDICENHYDEGQTAVVFNAIAASAKTLSRR